jgi:hypothetical protein
MPLPDFDVSGDLPPNVHRATLNEVLQRFGSTSGRRGTCTLRLSHIYELAQRTGHLLRFVIFGSYVTAEPDPNDIDVVLVMDDVFRLEECPIESRRLFDHALAQARYGASVFWIRPGLLIDEDVEDFIEYWQLKRDGSRRGIVEVIL